MNCIPLGVLINIRKFSDFAQKGVESTVQEARYEHYLKKKIKAIQLINKHLQTPINPYETMMNYGNSYNITGFTNSNQESPAKKNTRTGMMTSGLMSTNNASMNNSISFPTNMQMNEINSAQRQQARRVSFHSGQTPFSHFIRPSRNNATVLANSDSYQMVGNNQKLLKTSQDYSMPYQQNYQSFHQQYSNRLLYKTGSTLRSPELDKSSLIVNKDPKIELKVPLSYRLPDKIQTNRQMNTSKQYKVKTNLQQQAQELIENFEKKLMKKEKQVEKFQKLQKVQQRSRIQSADKRNEKFQSLQRQRSDLHKDLEDSSLVQFQKNLSEFSSSFKNQIDIQKKKAKEDYEKFKQIQAVREKANQSQRLKSREIDQKTKVDLEEFNQRIQTSIQRSQKKRERIKSATKDKVSHKKLKWEQKYSQIGVNNQDIQTQRMERQNSFLNKFEDINKTHDQVQMQKLKEILKRKELSKLKQEEHLIKFQEQRKLLEMQKQKVLLKHQNIEKKKEKLQKQYNELGEYDKVAYFSEIKPQQSLKLGNPLADVSLIYSGNKKLNKSRYKSEMHDDKSANETNLKLYY
ncbi:UNKNOWN [Stylonychia lemnae]|uniref:Uncharacterized protein n=1 Tax=Stylonychia lemnae TaxID=5949 RepID=A0A078A0J9_STYLE|nr:UNKNOWN [Stylonychia lemnae]|eukprot:CDW75377.1 UNKNOWN [Stylonychia lemnae]